MTTLRSIRAERKLSPDEVAQRGTQIDPAFPTTGGAVYNIERRGTDSYAILRVLAIIYDLPLEEVAAAAKTREPAGEICNKKSHKLLTRL